MSLRERNVANVGLVLSLDPFPSIINKDGRVTFQDISGRTILQTCKGQKTSFSKILTPAIGKLNSAITPFLK